MNRLITVVFVIMMWPLINIQASDSDQDLFYSPSSSPLQELESSAFLQTCLAKSDPEQFWSVTNEELENLFARSNDLVCIVDYRGKFMRLNQKWQDVLGYDLEKLKGSLYHTFIHPQDLEKTIEYE